MKMTTLQLLACFGLFWPTFINASAKEN